MLYNMIPYMFPKSDQPSFDVLLQNPQMFMNISTVTHKIRNFDLYYS